MKLDLKKMSNRELEILMSKAKHQLELNTAAANLVPKDLIEALSYEYNELFSNEFSLKTEVTIPLNVFWYIEECSDGIDIRDIEFEDVCEDIYKAAEKSEQLKEEIKKVNAMISSFKKKIKAVAKKYKVDEGELWDEIC